MTSDVPPVPRRRMLTVGDGDLSYSLAIVRAYGEMLHLTATTILSETELVATYAAAAATLTELRERGAEVRFEVDATSLGSAVPPLEIQDHIVFNHPHLGLADLADVRAHARRHEVLLAHFLASAAALVCRGGCVHLTLCGNQPRAWSIDAHSRRIGLSSPLPFDVTQPGLILIDAAGAASRRMPLAPPEEGWAARKRFRNGTLGSKHWLARYGYEHRRSEGDLDMHVDRSVELIWRLPPPPAADNVPAPPSAADEGTAAPTAHRCDVCGFAFASADELHQHVAALGKPESVDTLRQWRAQQQDGRSAEDDRVVADEAGGGGPALGATGAGAPASLAGSDGHACVHCGAVLSSRNQLFKHLSEGCDRSAARRANKACRLAVLVAYVGVRRHGVTPGALAEEAVRPTVGGDVLAAARRLLGGGGGDVSLSATPLVRTERGVSALQNWLLLTLPRPPSDGELLQFEGLLQPVGVRILAARRTMTSGVASATGNGTGASTGGEVALAHTTAALAVEEAGGAVDVNLNSARRPFPRGMLDQLRTGSGSAGGCAPTVPRHVTMLADGAAADVRHAALRTVFKCALPYALLLNAKERALITAGPEGERGAGGEPSPAPPPDGVLPAAAQIWVSGLRAAEADVRALLEPLRLPPFEVVPAPASGRGGFHALGFTSAADAAEALDRLDGQPLAGRQLVAMTAAEAACKARVHTRVKIAIRRIADGHDGPDGESGGAAGVGSGGKVGASGDADQERTGGAGLEGDDGAGETTRESGRPRPTKRRPRSFHNFSSAKARLRGTSLDGVRLHLVLDHCSSSVHEDLRARDLRTISEDLRARELSGDAPPGVEVDEVDVELDGEVGGTQSSGGGAAEVGGAAHVGESASETPTSPSSWARLDTGDWLVISFSAREFAPQQVAAPIPPLTLCALLCPSVPFGNGPHARARARARAHASAHAHSRTCTCPHSTDPAHRCGGWPVSSPAS